MENQDFDEIYNTLLSVFPPFFKRIHRLGEKLLKESGISKAHAQLLKCLMKAGTSTMSDLGNMLAVSKPNVTALVDKLVELNLVVRLLDEHDRRIVYIQLTNKGTLFMEEVIKSTKEDLKKSMQKLSEDDLQLLKVTMHNFKTISDKMI